MSKTIGLSEAVKTYSEMYDKTTNNNETVYSINYEIEALEKRKKELKKQRIEAILQETSEEIFNDNCKEPLNQREIKNILKGFYQDVKEILEG